MTRKKAEIEGENGILRQENARLKEENTDLRIEARAVEASLRRSLVDLTKQAAAEARARMASEERLRDLARPGGGG